MVLITTFGWDLPVFDLLWFLQPLHEVGTAISPRYTEEELHLLTQSTQLLTPVWVWLTLELTPMTLKQYFALELNAPGWVTIAASREELPQGSGS